MPDRWAELSLYVGLIPKGEFHEGRFDHSDQRPEATEYRNRVLARIIQYLHPPYDQFLRFGYDGVVASETDARRLVAFSEERFTESHGLVRPNWIMHGDIQFSKLLILPNAEPPQREELIRTMMSSGIGVQQTLQMTAMFDRVEDTWKRSLRYYNQGVLVAG